MGTSFGTVDAKIQKGPRWVRRGRHSTEFPGPRHHARSLPLSARSLKAPSTIASATLAKALVIARTVSSESSGWGVCSWTAI